MNIILFSKYSNICKKLIELIKNNEIEKNFIFDYICIDNVNYRSKLNKLDILHVPCILIIKEQNIDKYEGQDCFIWINDIIQQKMKLFQQQLLLSKNHNNKSPEEIIIKKKKTTFIDDIDDDDIDDNIDDNIDNKVEHTLFEDNNNFNTEPKKRPDHAKRENLLSTAMQMQKSRELEDKSLNPNNKIKL